jgi:hypothetical protein
METRLLQIEKQLPGLNGTELFEKSFEYCEAIANYYRALGRETSIKLTPDEVKLQFRRMAFVYQFMIDIYRDRFNSLMCNLKEMYKLKEISIPISLELTSTKMELVELHTNIIAKTDLLETYKRKS